MARVPEIAPAGRLERAQHLRRQSGRPATWSVCCNRTSTLRILGEIVVVLMAGCRFGAAKETVTVGSDPVGSFGFPPELYFRQLHPGDEIATSDSKLHGMARSMNNFIYVIGDRETKEAVVIDACWDIEGIFAAVRADGMNLTRAYVTHYHWDHIGGERAGGVRIPGIRELAAMGLPVSVPLLELDDAAESTGTLPSALSPLEDKQRIHVGRFTLEWLSTPGHSPGGMCVKLSTTPTVEPTQMEGNAGSTLLLISGDTVFPGSCGRLDLPGSDALRMYDSLQKLRLLPDELPIFPGHGYGGRHTTVGREKNKGLLRDMTRAEWDRRMVR